MTTLYGYWRSSASWRVRIALHLKEIAFQNVPVNIRAGAHLESEHEARNPFQQLPVLIWQEEGEARRLTQSMAILNWLDHRVPRPSLTPADPFLRARALELAEVVNAGIHPLQNAGVLADIERLGMARAQWAGTVIGRGLAALQTLASPTAGTFLVGDSVSVADVLLVPQLYNARRFDVDLGPFDLLTRVEARCAALPAFEAAHPDRQPDAIVSE